MLPVDHPERAAVGGCGGGYWWHSPEDTIDKADANVLASDNEVYVTMTLRMCTPEVVPYQFERSAQDFLDYASEYKSEAGDHFDFSEVVEAAEAFKAAAQKLDSAPISDAKVRHNGLRRLTRIINPVLFTISGPYEMDPTLQLPVLPGLAPAKNLAGLASQANDYRFLKTQLIRQRNRVCDALVQATELARELAQK
jgi:N-acetylated-alpha-linked acidic dipeptidase